MKVLSVINNDKDAVTKEYVDSKAGTTNYTDLTNKPQINGVTLSGNKTTSDLGITTPTKVSDLTNDTGYITGLVMLEYGKSTWQDFQNAFNSNKIVYCKVNGRMAFLAYISTSNVEFQYYRSLSSPSVSSQPDEVYVYTLTNANKWTTTTRKASSTIDVGTGLSRSYTNSSRTMKLSVDTSTIAQKSDLPTKTSDLTNDSGFITGYTETDPVFTASAASGITSSNISSWDGKQDALVSGTNIKTINNESLLGSGNITIQGGGTVNTYYLVNILNMTSTSDATYEIVNDLINNNQFVIFDDPDGRSRELFCYVPIKTFYQSDLDYQLFWYIDSLDKYNLVVISHSGTSVIVTRTTYHSIEEAYNLADGKQNALVSGTNIKTINNQSILGSGNITIEGGGGTPTDVRINGTSITSDSVANIITQGTYNASSNKIATMDDLPADEKVKQLNNTTSNAALRVLFTPNILDTAYTGEVNKNSSFTYNPSTKALVTGGTVNGYNLAEASEKSVDSSISAASTSTNLPTSQAVASFVEGKGYTTNTGTITGVSINGTSVATSGVANIATEGTYNASSNKIATMSDITPATTLEVARYYSTGTKVATLTKDSEDFDIYVPTDSTIPSSSPSSTNLPTSSAVSTFVNSKISTKQDTLTSGTNIKTVNNTSLLGSGNISVQPTLVSGTNIKTINSTSLLGNGNITVQPTLVSGTNIKTINNTSLLGSGNINTLAPTSLADTYQTSGHTYKDNDIVIYNNQLYQNTGGSTSGSWNSSK